MQERNVDIVHTHNFYAGFYGISAARLRGRTIRIVHGEHGMAQYKRKRRLLIGRVIYPLAHKIVTMSKDQELFFKRLGIPGDKLVTILNGVDLSRFNGVIDREEKKTELGLSGANAIIGCVGRLSEEKGHQYLIRAIKHVNQKIPGVHLVLVGDGAARTALGELTRELDMERLIHFFGNRDDVNEIYPVLDLFCLPSLTEGLANALLEAMACRLPIVATSVGGNKELLTQMKNGVMVPSGSATSLAEAITMVLSDGGLRTSLAETGRRFVEEKFSLKRMVDDYANLYLELRSRERNGG